MPQPSSPPTLQDVARAAGVSIATASRALHPSDRTVGEQYRVRVLAAAAALGYTANVSAQAIARGTSRTIALVVSDIADPFFASIASGAMRAADSAEYVVVLAVTGRRSDRELAIVRAMRGQRPAAIVLVGSRSRGEAQEALVAELRSFEASGGRVVVVGGTDLPFDAVAVDDTDAGRMLAARLADRGYRAPLVLAGPEDLLTASRRADGLREGFLHAGVAAPRIVHGPFDRDATQRLVEGLLAEGLSGVDCVIAVNDVMAIGALAALRDAGIPVPSHVAVAGFDDIPQARDSAPPLTTVRLPLEEMGAESVRLALADSAGGGDRRFALEVVERSSTR